METGHLNEECERAQRYSQCHCKHRCSGFVIGPSPMSPHRITIALAFEAEPIAYTRTRSPFASFCACAACNRFTAGRVGPTFAYSEYVLIVLPGSIARARAQNLSYQANGVLKMKKSMSDSR